MTIDNFANFQFSTFNYQFMKLLGIDYGTKRIGLAVGDTDSKIASPIKTLSFDESFWSNLKSIVREERIEKIIVGMPKSLGVKRNEETKMESEKGVERFIEKLKNLKISIETEDERFSTHLANRLLGNIKKDRDAVAAAVILQSYLDRPS